jgi:hypothetical protein
MGRESVFAFGFEYGNFWGSFFAGTQEVKTQRATPAANVFFYTIRDGRTVGFFVHTFVGYPNMGTVDGIRPEYTDYTGGQAGFFLGPLFRLTFNENFTLFCGTGPSFYVTTERYTQYAPLTDKNEYFSRGDFNAGIGANVMLKYKVNKRLLLFAGCIVTWDFSSDFTIEARPSNSELMTSGRVQDFSMFGLRTYVSFGFRL